MEIKKNDLSASEITQIKKNDVSASEITQILMEIVMPYGIYADIVDIVLNVYLNPAQAESEFAIIREKIASIRKQKAIKDERSKKAWKDADSHYIGVLGEEIYELKDELKDETALFKLASIIGYQNGMHEAFDNLISIKEKLRKLFSSIMITTFGTKKHVADPEGSDRCMFYVTKFEEQARLQDNLELYGLATKASYKKGVKIISEELGNYFKEILNEVSEDLQTKIR